MNQAEFARKYNVSRKTATIWKKRGWILFDRAGQVDESASAAAIAKHRNSAAPQAKPKRRAASSTMPAAAEPEVLDDAAVQEAARLVDATGERMTFEEAKRVKTCYEAMRARLEHDREARLVVEVGAVAEIVGAQLAVVRTQLLSIPSSHAPQIHRLKTVTEVQAYLYDAICETLTGLSGAAALIN